MITPEEAGLALKKYFAEVTSKQFLQDIQRYCPELLVTPDTEGTESLPMLMPANSFQLPLSAYIACEVASPKPTEETHPLKLVLDIVQEVCKQYGITITEHPDDIDIVLYLNNCPSLEDKPFVPETESPVPTLLLQQGATVSMRRVDTLATLKLELTYAHIEGLKSQLQEVLREARPLLEQRKLGHPTYKGNLVGEKIRLLREEQRVTREEIACNSASLSVERFRLIEQLPDALSNPSLLELRQIAYLLRTTVADLVEPDLQRRFLA